MNRLGLILPIFIMATLPVTAAHADTSQAPPPAASTDGTTTTTTTTGGSGNAELKDRRELSFPTVGVSAGTRALGLELGLSVNPFFGIRAIGSRMDVSYSTTRNSIDYKGNYDFRSASLLGDWYPDAGSFRISVGAVRNRDRIDAEAQPASNGVIIVNGGYPLAPGDRLHAAGYWPHRNIPYVGIGWGNPADHHEGVGFSLDLGAMYTRNPRVTLTATGPDAGNPVTQAQVQQEQDKLNADLRHIKFFPVASLGVYVGF